MKNPILGLILTIGLACGFVSNTYATEKTFEQKGVASWYGGKFNGKKTASGERLDPSKLTVAHKYLPFGTIVKITNLNNGKIIKARVNDRGPFVQHRIIDLSTATAKAVGLNGTALVKIETQKPLEVAQVPDKPKHKKKGKKDKH